MTLLLNEPLKKANCCILHTALNFLCFQIEFKYGECVTDLQLVGAKFVHDSGRGFCVTGYDNSDLIFFVQ